MDVFDDIQNTMKDRLLCFFLLYHDMSYADFENPGLSTDSSCNANPHRPHRKITKRF